MTNDERNGKIAEDRALLSQQNKEYAESLAKDLAKKEEKEKVRLAAERKELRKKTIQEYREKLKEVKSTGPHRLLVRYPAGPRQIIFFSPSDPLTSLFDAVIAHPACPDYFTVRSVYPKAEIQCFPEWYTTILQAEFEGSDDVATTFKPTQPTPEKTSMGTISNNSILFINMIHY